MQQTVLLIFYVSSTIIFCEFHGISSYFVLPRRKNKLEPDDVPQKTTISLGSNERGNLYQPTGLCTGGFQFGENYVTGSIALLPGTVLKWNVGHVYRSDIIIIKC